jgi:2-polyprenyl-3-methyl-5-hydroxy-6-metoxy-1,4-benzoquinol methylase
MSLRSYVLVRYADSEIMKQHGVSSETFLEIYKGGAPWEIGRPQSEIVRLERSGPFRGAILDVGCGQGENALYLASAGYEVHAIDFVDAVVQHAQEEMKRRMLKVKFETLDALQVSKLGRTFDTVLDSATFHTFSDDQRAQYMLGLAQIMRPGAILHLICLSELETRPGGARRVTREELRSAFSLGWEIESIREVRYLANLFPDGARAWAAAIRKC